MEKIKKILIDRDEITEEEAENLIKCAKEDLKNEEYIDDICNKWFGLEPDYIFELLSE